MTPPAPARLRSPAPDGVARFHGTVDGVELWWIALDAPTVATPPERLAVLDATERARAARFVFERDRVRFVAGRAALRRILAAYTGTPPGALAFALGRHGKPSLPGGPPFSFSNSQGSALCAVGLDREVGVDLEALRELPDAAGIARSAFTAEERAAWQAAGGGGGAAFLRLWTRKEAALKALGVGLAALDGGSPPPDAVELHDLPVDAGYVAALAVLR